MYIKKLLEYVTFLLLTEAAYITKPEDCIEYPCLVFNEEFNTFDQSVWQHVKTAPANEFQYYTNNRTNSFVKKGVLYIKPTLTNATYSDAFLYSGTLDLWGSTPQTQCTSNLHSGCLRHGSSQGIINPIQSASIRTAESFSFKYGRMEVNARLPRGDWIRPQVSLMPKYSAYGDWPASGEVDVLESRGNDNLKSMRNGRQVGNTMVSQSIQWGPYINGRGHAKTSETQVLEDGTFTEDFHNFTVEWTEDFLSLFVDDNLSFNVSIGEGGFWEYGGFVPNTFNPWLYGTPMAPFDQHFFITINVAVGGSHNFDEQYTPSILWRKNAEGAQAKKDFWENNQQWLPTWKDDDIALKVDSVRVWKMRKPKFLREMHKVSPPEPSNAKKESNKKNY